MLFVLAIAALYVSSAKAITPLAQFDVMLDLWTRIVTPDPSKVVAAWQTTPTATTICSYPGLVCDGSDNIIVFVMHDENPANQMWVDVADQNSWDIGNGLRTSAPNYHDLVDLRAMVLTVGPASTGIIPGSEQVCTGGSPADLPDGLAAFILAADDVSAPGVTVGTVGVLEDNFMATGSCYTENGLFALAGLPSAVIDLDLVGDGTAADREIALSDMALVRMPAAIGALVRLPDAMRSAVFSDTSLTSLDDAYVCATDPPTLPDSTFVSMTSLFQNPSCVAADCGIAPGDMYVSGDNDLCRENLAGVLYETSNFTVEGIIFVEPIPLGSWESNVDVSCAIRIDHDDCFNCEALPPGPILVKCRDCNGNNAFDGSTPGNTLEELDVLISLQSRLSSDPLKLKAEWRDPILPNNMCDLPGVVCDSECQVVELVMPTSAGVWVDDNDQNSWDMGTGSRSTEPYYHELDDLEFLILSANAGTVGVVPGSASPCSVLSPTQSDLPLMLQSYGVIGQLSAPPTDLLRGSPGVMEDNFFSQDFLARCHVIPTLSFVRLPTLPVNFDDMSGQIETDDHLVFVPRLFFSDMPLVTGSKIRIPGDGVHITFVRTGITGLDDDHFCSEDFDTSRIVVTGTPTFVNPPCMAEFCLIPDFVGRRSLVLFNNDACIIGQNVNQDTSIEIALAQQNITADLSLVNVTIPTAGFTGYATIRCIAGRDNDECVDCFRNEPREGIPFLSIDICGICGGDNSTCSDCTGTPAGSAVYDLCDVCEGDNACVDCVGVPFGTAEYDVCDVCCGDEACVDCAGVVNGDAVVDRCGVCGGNNACAACKPSERDLCGVCHGDESSCRDCEGTLHGSKVADACGVCEGDSSSCADCHGVPNGSATYDLCDVCGGDNTSCVGCDGVLGSRLCYDRCGVCGGNDECVDCEGRVCGLSVEDECGVCNGDGTSCADCNGTPHGTWRVNRCVQCVDPAVHPLDGCDDESLTHAAHDRLVELGWLGMIAALIFALLAAVTCRMCGRRVLRAVMGMCSGAVDEGDVSLLDDHNSHSLNDSESAARRRKSKKKEKKTGGSGGAPMSGSLAIMCCLCVCMPVGVAAVPASNSAERLYDELCEFTTIGLLPGMCDEARGNACTHWASAGINGRPIVECYESVQSYHEVVSGVYLDRLPSPIGGSFSRAAWRASSTATDVRIVSDGALMLADWTDAGGHAVLFAGFVQLEHLELRGVNIGGVQLPASIMRATALRRLRISDVPDLVGSDDVLCTLSHITEIVLRRTSVGGELACAGFERAWSSLVTLDVRGSQFESPLPDLSALGDLEQLLADNNLFNDAFPSPSLFPPSLLELCLAENDFAGALPTGWNVHLPLLQTFYADGNRLNGTVPIFNFAEMTRFGISNNAFEGSLPNAMTSSPGYLVLRVNNNLLYAPFPPFEEEQLCGECAFQCNDLCYGNPYAESSNFNEIVRAGCSVSIEPADLCAGGCGDRSCLGCDGVPNSGATFDDCGICGGDNTACCDCEGVVHGTAVADVCGVCNGDASSCADCAGTPHGTARYDVCGVCNGDGETCTDCAGTPNGDAVYDECDVCQGNNESCTDCTGVVNGPALRDEAGVCNGFGEANIDSTQNGLTMLVLALVFFAIALCFFEFGFCAAIGRYKSEISRAKRLREGNR